MSDKNTIITEYGDCIQIIEYFDGFCGCCYSNFFNEWYDNNEAYFVRKGVFVIDNLMSLETTDQDGKDVLKDVRYSFTFDFTNPDVSYFSIINYYNREKVADFSFTRSDFDDVRNAECKVTFMDLKAFERLGYFTNTETRKKIDRYWDIFHKRYDSLPIKKYKEAFEKQVIEENKIYLSEMCNHSLLVILSLMCYYTKEKPEQISYESFTIKEDLEYTTKKQKYSYKYTGYINLNDNKIYRTTIKSNLKEEKKKEYQRHIESWSVRGHYRTIKGKKVWIKEHTRGDGELEKRIYGTKPESEMLLIPKIVECEREIKILAEKKSTPKDILVFEGEEFESKDFHISSDKNTLPIKTNEAKEVFSKKRASIWHRIKQLIIKFLKPSKN